NGPGASLLSISGNHASRVFQIDHNVAGSVTASISGLTITGGSASVSGGGLYNLGNVTLTNVIVSGNTAGRGGGLCNISTGTATLINSVLSSNSCVFDGG